MKTLEQLTADLGRVTESIRTRLNGLAESAERDQVKNGAIAQLISLADLAEDSATAILFND